MRITISISVFALISWSIALVGCVDRDLCDEPFRCPEPGTAINCSFPQSPGSVCENSACICWLEQNCDVEVIERPFACGLTCVDGDLEPNDHQDLAVTLPCGDDAVNVDPTEYFARCPSRDNPSNGFTALEICTGGDRDFYQIFLLAEETAVIDVLFSQDAEIPSDLDARAVRWEPSANDWIEVARASTETDNETFTISTSVASGNPQGWYVLEVHGKTVSDTNAYTISYSLSTP